MPRRARYGEVRSEAGGAQPGRVFEGHMPSLVRNEGGLDPLIGFRGFLIWEFAGSRANALLAFWSSLFLPEAEPNLLVRGETWHEGDKTDPGHDATLAPTHFAPRRALWAFSSKSMQNMVEFFPKGHFLWHYFSRSAFCLQWIRNRSPRVPSAGVGP